MKVIEGTPQEISEYLKKEEKSVNFADAVRTSFAPTGAPTSNNGGFFKKWRLLSQSHWSHSKQEWIPISSMNSVYIVNVLRKALNRSRATELLEDDEFKSLILNLHDKILE